MSDSFPNVIFIIAALVIFIGRTILGVKKKKKDPPPPVPVREKIQEDDDFRPHWERTSETHGVQKVTGKAAAPESSRVRQIQPPKPKKVLSTIKKGTASKGLSAGFNKPAYQSSIAASYSTPSASLPNKSSARSISAGSNSREQKAFPLNLDHLSPMKQAVIMAEILGTPKGML